VKDLYNKTIEIEGRKYQYDADFDCFRRVQDDTDSKYGWIVVIVVLALVTFLIEYFNK
jgi:hypothetical protein